LTSPTRPRIEVGTKIGQDLTVLGIVDERHDEPIYLVWHHQYWCPMACKVLESAEAAQDQADILLKAAHPNVVRCFGLNGSNCVLMEFLEGPNLHRFMQSRPKERLGINDAVRLAIHVGAALLHVHKVGLLHMDVKPSNVILVKGRPVLIDFGIARWQTAPRPRSIRGTAPYMAPEECLRGTITPAADVFGLGVTLYELLTGNLPFPEKGKGKELPQVRLAPAPMRRYRPAVRGGLERLVLSCLNRDPAERPKLPELLAALHKFIDANPPMWPKDFTPSNSEKRVSAVD
jgi:eukaryotic-like serine/threonine-protein kinase